MNVRKYDGVNRLNEHHAGGVIPVNYTSNYGIVPEALLENNDLSHDARLVAAWLATRPIPWTIVIEVIRRRLGIGKNQWLRIAKELKKAGYLYQNRSKTASGAWLWDIRFCSDPNVLASTIVSQGDHGDAVHGNAAGGGPVDGARSHIEVPPKALPIKQYQETTTTNNVVVVVVEDELVLDNPVNPSDGEKQKEDAFHRRIVDSYHQECKSLPKVIGGYESLSSATKANLAARAKEYPDLAFWEDFFQRVERSDFMCGRIANKSGFQAGLKWLLIKENILKTLETSFYASSRRPQELFGRGDEDRNYDDRKYFSVFEKQARNMT